MRHWITDGALNCRRSSSRHRPRCSGPRCTRHSSTTRTPRASRSRRPRRGVRSACAGRCPPFECDHPDPRSRTRSLLRSRGTIDESAAALSAARGSRIRTWQHGIHTNALANVRSRDALRNHQCSSLAPRINEHIYRVLVSYSSDRRDGRLGSSVASSEAHRRHESSDRAAVNDRTTYIPSDM